MTDVITLTEPVVRRHRRRWPCAAAFAAGAGACAVALLLTHSSPPPVNVACQRATAAQNTFVEQSIAAGYPNGPIGQVMQVQAADIALLHNMTEAGCPDNTQFEALPDGS